MNQDNNTLAKATAEDTNGFLTLQELWTLIRERWYIVLG